ncbi:glycosyl hydrolase family 65 protein [Mucilaginibacter sp. P25]|uniref:glycosyl hydrolase family 65 protein n=1 Tax=unclassified Mucilaginibacter TaxID=2617802 RepID=UPI003D66BEBA
MIISDLVGLKPREDNLLEIFPLIPKNQWKWFALDNVLYHGHTISVVWDKNGTKYHKGKGFIIYADGKMISRSTQLKHVLVKLPV